MEAIKFISYIFGHNIASINLTIIQQQLISTHPSCSVHNGMQNFVSMVSLRAQMMFEKPRHFLVTVNKCTNNQIEPIKILLQHIIRAPRRATKPLGRAERVRQHCTDTLRGVAH